MLWPSFSAAKVHGKRNRRKPENLEKEYDNYHFEEEIQENDVVFDYKLRTGRAMTRNAIRLLAMIGYDPKIIEAAQESAKHFEETGVWK